MSSHLPSHEETLWHLACSLRVTTIDSAVQRTSREGIDMVYVFAIIANGLLATIAYLVVTWIWDE